MTSHAINTSRRGMLAAIALAPVAAMPVAAAALPSRFESVIAEYWRTFNWLNNLRDEVSEAEEERANDVYHAAYCALINEPPTNADQFMRKFYAIWSDGGNPNSSNTDIVVEDAARLIAH